MHSNTCDDLSAGLILIRCLIYNNLGHPARAWCSKELPTAADLPKQGQDLNPLMCEISNPLRAWMWGLHWNEVFFLFPVDHTLCNSWFEPPWWRMLWKHVRVSVAETMHVQKPLCQRHSLGTGAELVTLACPVHTIGHSTVGRQLEKPANGVIHEKGVILLSSTIKHEFSTFCMNKTTISTGIRRYIIGWRKHPIFAKNSQVFDTWTKPPYRYVPALLFLCPNTMTGVYMER